MKHVLLILCCAVLLLWATAGCKTVELAGQGLATVGQATGVLTAEQAEGVSRSSTAVASAMDRITPEQEYYIGRTVGATIVSSYKVYDDPAATQYVNLLGQTLAAASDRPETFGGYHVLILDSDEINAFAAPGGFLFISRGLLRCCKSEDAVAAVLAHEVAHVENRDGLGAIKKSRLTTVFTVLAAEAGKSLGGEELAELTRAFEGSIADVTQTLVNSGYARKQEYAADRDAIALLERVGYDPTALADMLRQMEERMDPEGHDFAKTHPPPGDRLKQVAERLGDSQPSPARLLRQQRFEQALGGI